VIVVEG